MTLHAEPALTAESTPAPAARTRGARKSAPLPDAPPPAPAQPSVAPPAPAAGEVELIHIKALIASPLNPRKSFPEDEIAELADSIAVNGLLQPLTARKAVDYLENIPSAREVYIGGRRLRALEKLFAEGRWPLDRLPDHRVPVIRRDVGDLELLQIAVAENVNRQDMHPLEEGDAFSLLRQRDKSTEEIAAAYGKTKRWVELRIQIATGLDDETRALFAAGTINMETARILVRLTPAERKGIVKAIEKGDVGYENGEEIKRRIAEGLPEVSKAIFDLNLYTGEYTVGGQHSQTKRFSDVEQFRELQTAAIGAKAEELARQWAFVEQVKQKGNYFISSDYGFDRMWGRADPAVHGAVIAVRADLSVEIVEGVCRGKAPPVPTKAEAKASGDAVAAIGTSWREHAHRCKTVALQSSILRTGHRAALEMAIVALLGDGTIAKIRTESTGPEGRAVAPEVAMHLQAWRDRLGPTAFDTLDPDRRDGQFLSFRPGYKEVDLKPRAGIYEAIGQLSDVEVANLFDALVASRCGSWAQYGADGPSLGDRPLAIMAARRYQVDMAEAWRIDADYLSKLQRADLLALARQINAWCKANRRYGLPIGEETMAGYKVADLRDTIARHVADQDVRLVPAEMTFAPEKTIMASLRAAAHLAPKAAEPQQLDIVDAINAAKSKPTTATVRWIKAKTLELQHLVNFVAAELPQHPDFGKPEIYLAADGARLLLDAAKTCPGEYWIIGIEGRHGDATPDEMASVMRGWLQSVGHPPAPAAPLVDQPAEADAAIDQLFDDSQIEEEEEEKEPVKLQTFAFVISEHADLSGVLLDSFADALPRHPDYGQSKITIRGAGPTLLGLTCDTVDNEENGDPDLYRITYFHDGVASIQGMPMPADKVEKIITDWLASLTTCSAEAA
ncbi:ParB/RepB/Spo0J family partition protein [Azospirillum picis]|uniref:ParB/RepB/Spo0J family partition protein n=1 Tax=Azospirillum picis TaxID=488438 RepID=A0ABU0MUL1_9PROT|nr:ParB/RepB/Spo0J family partition protein [Azospirillum picis]MBP2303300.1 ParB/RepB/Spo0J family partition protein [Azospirillum picis]MDQ0537160.1 ParB/RepB/Spo0J family partition protein [Azospirillum picis]